MTNLNSVAVFVFLVSWNLCFALYLPRQQQQRPQQHQGRGYLPRSNAANNALSPQDIWDFEYVPTAQGYRYSYTLNNGFSNGAHVITNDHLLPLAQYSGIDAKNTGLNSVGIGGRHKNRKLSPKSLQSLAG